jgi:ketosteroid isomerase-like protein
MPPDEPPIIGIEAIRPEYAAVFDSYSFDFRGEIQDVTVAAPFAVVRASIEETLTAKSGGEQTEYRGACLMVLWKQVDGSWQL